MSNPIKCFWLEPTTYSLRFLRRYSSGSECAVCPQGYHDAVVFIGEFPSIEDAEGYQSNPDASEYKLDNRWPTQAPCGYIFLPEDEWQVNTEKVYKSGDGSDYTLRQAPAGAMWNAFWMKHLLVKSPDGLCPVVRCPGGGDWTIDSRANNCTMPNDNEHRCWIRHGVVPNLTVDKNGKTCAAGAGSIQTSNWHGFLRDGFLVE